MRRIEVGGEGEGIGVCEQNRRVKCVNASPRQPQRRLVQRRRLPRARPRRSERASHRAHLARRAVTAVAALTRRTVPTLARKLDGARVELGRRRAAVGHRARVSTLVEHELTLKPAYQ